MIRDKIAGERALKQEIFMVSLTLIPRFGFLLPLVKIHKVKP